MITTSGPAYGFKGDKNRTIDNHLLQKGFTLLYDLKSFKIVLGQTVSRKETVDEKMLQKVLCNETNWDVLGFSAFFLDGL